MPASTTATWPPCQAWQPCSSSRGSTRLMLISGDEQLAAFRATLDGRLGLDLVRRGGRVLVQLPVGVGKSRWLLRIILAAIESAAYALVVVLCPTRRVLDESEQQLRP